MKTIVMGMYERMKVTCVGALVECATSWSLSQWEVAFSSPLADCWRTVLLSAFYFAFGLWAQVLELPFFPSPSVPGGTPTPLNRMPSLRGFRFRVHVCESAPNADLSPVRES